MRSGLLGDQDRKPTLNSVLSSHDIGICVRADRKLPDRKRFVVEQDLALYSRPFSGSSKFPHE